MDVLAAIRTQISEAKADLAAYRPEAIDWQNRAETTVTSLIPWLRQGATGAKSYVEAVLNAPVALRSQWKRMRSFVNLPASQLDEFERQLALDDVLRESVTGEVISNVIIKHLIAQHPDKALCPNGRSDYPDLYLATLDYSALPAFKRKKKVTEADEYGAALKGAAKRPVRVPDGLEIKSCRDRIAVDCHHPHAGLHLVLLYSESSKLFTVKDLRIAFLRHANYRESARNTTATTVKYSFGDSGFVSLLGHPRGRVELE